MPITQNVFKLKDVYDLVRAGCITYGSTLADPGSLWVWGENASGNFGLNTFGIPSRISSPTQLPGCWTYVRSAGDRTFGVRSDNTLWAWGLGAGGVLGVNNTISYSSPVQIPGTTWAGLSAGGYDDNAFAIKTNGTLWAWGCNVNGGLGVNNTTAYSSPVQIPGTQWCKVTGSGSISAALKTDNTLWTWGTGYCGAPAGSSPIQIPGTQWCDVFSMNANSFALKTDGTLWVWGNNDSGQLGQNNITTVACGSSPVQVPGTWCDVALTSNCTYIGVRNDGTLWAWGRGTEGQIGNGAATNRSSPIQIPGTTWKYAGAGQVHTFSVKCDGTLWAMGSNSNGMLGNNSSVPSSSPIQVPGSWFFVYESDTTSMARRC